MIRSDTTPSLAVYCSGVSAGQFFHHIDNQFAFVASVPHFVRIHCNHADGIATVPFPTVPADLRRFLLIIALLFSPHSIDRIASLAHQPVTTTQITRLRKDTLMQTLHSIQSSLSARLFALALVAGSSRQTSNSPATVSRCSQ